MPARSHKSAGAVKKPRIQEVKDGRRQKRGVQEFRRRRDRGIKNSALFAVDANAGFLPTELLQLLNS
jgi:hypothetical protein